MRERQHGGVAWPRFLGLHRLNWTITVFFFFIGGELVADQHSVDPRRIAAMGGPFTVGEWRNDNGKFRLRQANGERGRNSIAIAGISAGDASRFNGNSAPAMV